MMRSTDKHYSIYIREATADPMPAKAAAACVFNAYRASAAPSCLSHRVRIVVAPI